LSVNRSSQTEGDSPAIGNESLDLFPTPLLMPATMWIFFIIAAARKKIKPIGSCSALSCIKFQETSLSRLFSAPIKLKPTQPLVSPALENLRFSGHVCCFPMFVIELR
jgi:hypothetical protein